MEVIATKSQDIPWVVSLDGKRAECDKIRRVSIDKFYEIVTGDRFAFVNLCRVLPKAIDDVLKTVEIEPIHDSVFDELEKLSPNILKSIFLLAFSGYEGFDEY